MKTLKFGTDSFKLLYTDDPTILLQLPRTGIYGLDIETSKKENFKTNKRAGLDVSLSDVRLIQIYSPTNNTVYVLDMRTAFAREAVLKLFFADREFIAHNAVFEKKFLPFIKTIHCSMLMGMLEDRATHSPYEPEEEIEGVSQYKKRGGYGLANLVERHFKVKIGKELQVSDWSQENLTAEQINYAALDAFLTWKLGKHLFPKLKSLKLVKSYKLLNMLQFVLAEMENNGFYMNKEKHSKLVRDWQRQETAALLATKKFFPGVNLNSSKQMNDWLENILNRNPGLRASWPKTAKGKYSFNQHDLYPFRKYKAIKALTEYKGVNKLLTTYGEALDEKVSPATGRLHSSFSVGETRTGRLSSRDPNLQNQPRDGTLREVFEAPEGSVLVRADFSQIELRVAAELSRDPVMLKAFSKGIDLHKLIVSQLSGKDIDKVSKEERQLGKAINFGLAFGMGPNKLRLYALQSYDVHLSEEEAYKAWNTYHKLYRVYSVWCDSQRSLCKKIGYVRTPLGRMRKLEEDEAYTRAVNTPVQGGAAEVCYVSLIRLHADLRGKGWIKIVNCIHDEILLEVAKVSDDAVEGAKALLQSAMEYGMQYVFPKASLNKLVEVSVGKSWAEAKA